MQCICKVIIVVNYVMIRCKRNCVCAARKVNSIRACMKMLSGWIFYLFFCDGSKAWESMGCVGHRSVDGVTLGWGHGTPMWYGHAPRSQHPVWFVAIKHPFDKSKFQCMYIVCIVMTIRSIKTYFFNSHKFSHRINIIYLRYSSHTRSLSIRRISYNFNRI